MQKYFVKIDRFAAWVLLITVIIYIVSGFGMTKGIIDSSLARSLHFEWLGAIGLAAFSFHTFWAIHLALMRHKIWNIWTKIFLMAIYLILIAGAIYVGAFYQPVSQSSAAANQTPSATSSFTAAELAKYNGLNGMPDYAAVDGIVYDFSSAYRNGNHHGCAAGADITEEYYREHDANLLKKYTIVGTLNSGN